MYNVDGTVPFNLSKPLNDAIHTFASWIVAAVVQVTFTLLLYQLFHANHGSHY